jgi:signal transduction histidine kinase
MAIGAAGLLGWILRTPGLKSISSAWVPMKANTGVGLLAAGGSLLLLTRPAKRRISPTLAALVGTIGVLTCLEYILHVNLHIDQLLFTEPPGAISTSSPGRMAFISAVDFALVSIALLTVERRPDLAHSISLVSLAIAMTATFGYLFGVDMLIGGRHSHMAVHTAIAFDAVSLGILALNTKRTFLAVFVSDRAGGRLLRRALPLTILILVVLARFRVYAQNAGWVSSEVATSLIVLANTVAITLLLWSAARQLNREEGVRRLTQAQLLESERERADELAREVEIATRELAASNRELESFSYSVSHDLRAPLRAIDGFSAAILEDHADRLDDDGKRYLERIRAAASRMGKLIDDLLQLAKLTREPLNREAIDVSALVQSIAAELAAHIGQRQVELVVEPGVSGHADSRLLRVVLENLLGNAYKFSSRVDAARVEFGVHDENGERAFFVRDNGAGFDPKYAHKLFGVFQRLHRATDFPGTGVGLATVDRVVRRHGGRVWASSSVGAGATFFFTLGDDKTPHQPGLAASLPPSLD